MILRFFFSILKEFWLRNFSTLIRVFKHLLFTCFLRYNDFCFVLLVCRVGSCDSVIVVDFTVYHNSFSFFFSFWDQAVGFVAGIVLLYSTPFKNLVNIKISLAILPLQFYCFCILIFFLGHMLRLKKFLWSHR